MYEKKYGGCKRKGGEVKCGGEAKTGGEVKNKKVVKKGETKRIHGGEKRKNEAKRW